MNVQMQKPQMNLRKALFLTTVLVLLRGNTKLMIRLKNMPDLKTTERLVYPKFDLPFAIWPLRLHICIASSHWAICVHPGSILKRQVLWEEEIWESFSSHIEHKNHLGWGKKLHMWEVISKAAVSEEGITNWYLYRITHLEQIIKKQALI